MNKMIRWGILGTASIADQVSKAIQTSTNSELTAISSRDINKAKSWADERNIPLYYGSYDEMINSGEIDVVYNPLPNSMHAEWTIKSLEAGLHVLCEKPFAANAKEVSELIAISKSTGKKAAEAFMYRFHPVYKKIRNLIRNGEIGKLISVYSVFNFFLDDRNEIPASKSLAGGALMDVGCYCVNVSRLITESNPLRVTAMGNISEVDDTLIGIMEFPDRILCHFECSIESSEKHFLRISGTRGIIEVESPWFPGLDEATINLIRDEQTIQHKTNGADCYLLEVQDFADACLENKNPSFSIEDAGENMAVIDALFKSIQENRTATVKYL